MTRRKESFGILFCFAKVEDGEEKEGNVFYSIESLSFLYFYTNQIRRKATDIENDNYLKYVIFEIVKSPVSANNNFE